MAALQIGIYFSSCEDAYDWEVVSHSGTILAKVTDVSPFVLDKQQIVDAAVFGVSQQELQAYLHHLRSYLAAGEPEDEKAMKIAHLEIFNRIDEQLQPIIEEAAKDTERWKAVWAKLQEEQEAEERANAEVVERLWEAKWDEEGHWIEVDRRMR
jgi:hypothetical protein